MTVACVLAVVLSGTIFSVAAIADSGSFFFDSEAAQGKQRAAFSAQQRDRLLVNAYACNKSAKSPVEAEACKEREMSARRQIQERTLANHKAAEHMRMEMRGLYESMSPER